MGWVEALLLTVLIAATANAALGAWHQWRCPACRAARQAVRERHPDWTVSDTRHRASEPDRDVVAVFYRLPRVIIEPPPYRLVAVGHDGGIEELPDDIESPYAIRGRK